MKAIIFDYFGVLAYRYGQPDETVIKLIRGRLLGRYKLAVLSNMSGGSAEEMLGEQAELFDVVLLSGEIGVAKPDARAFLEAVRQLGEFPSDCLMIDDSQINFAAARQAGLEAIYFTGVANLERELEKYGILTP